MKLELRKIGPALAHQLRRFRDEDGAVTVDWVVLTAAVVGIGLLVMIPTFTTADSSAAVLADELVAAVVAAAGL
ncbi:pilus assembly protein [Aliigemmobacter aestuarii]|uniref:Pilus assembly protein n=1 Tax=Aliigemmobacter aestuarii TaxID=1445661 RepID=A0A4S3MJH5_9RHOB|nr:pilus assembly protein [Gemmobacter aestuarii]THD81585.1 pilus assembly protein [Gemmobacter aestuarii]